MDKHKHIPTWQERCDKHAGIVTHAMIQARMQEEIDDLRDDNERLHRVARNVYEVWAGSEGIPQPETAAEAYLLQLVEQMRDEAKNGLHNAGIER